MNLRTLGDFKKEDDSDGKKKKNTTSYTGGESSGMAVINPDVAGVIEKADRNSQSQEDFVEEEKKKNSKVVKITLYENGFVVNDGQFQDYNDPKSKDFMKELNEGKVPRQLRKQYANQDVSISIRDKTGQQYTPPPKPAYVKFSGEGVSLSEPAKDPKFAKKSNACQNFILQANKNKEVTTMRVRLQNGSTITMEANLDSSLQDVHNHIATLSGVSTFQLFGGFPPKALNLGSTVQGSDLADGTLIQK